MQNCSSFFILQSLILAWRIEHKTNSLPIVFFLLFSDHFHYPVWILHSVCAVLFALLCISWFLTFFLCLLYNLVDQLKGHDPSLASHRIRQYTTGPKPLWLVTECGPLRNPTKSATMRRKWDGHIDINIASLSRVFAMLVREDDPHSSQTV